MEIQVQENSIKWKAYGNNATGSCFKKEHDDLKLDMVTIFCVLK